MKTAILRVILVAVVFCAGCSSAIRKPPVPEGDPVPANDQRALEEIVRAAVAAANPQQLRFVATRGETLKEVLLRWTRLEHIQLAYLTDFNPTLHGAINEPDLRAAGIALSVLLQHEGNGALMDFTTPGLLVVNDAH